jgi:hypothetical protein
MESRHPPPRIVVDGREGEEGRALMVLSALYHCAEALVDRPILFVDVESEAVQIGVGALCWDTGLQATALPPRQPLSLDRTCLFAAILRRGVAGPRLHAARQAGATTLIAVQFPSSYADAGVLDLVPAAHDPCRFADRLVAALAQAKIL